MNFFQSIQAGLAATLVATVFTAAPAAATEDTLVALGYVTRYAPRHRVVNATNGTLDITEGTTGIYYITIESAGEFTTASPQDFAIEVGNDYTGSNDKVAVAHVSYLDPNRLTVTVSLSDAEDSADPHLAEPSRHDFYFAIRRLPGNGVGSTTGSPHDGYNSHHTIPVPPRFPSEDRIDGDTRYLAAFGKIDSDGELASGYGVDGIDITASRTTQGKYEVVLQKPGAFATDIVVDYLAFATPAVQGSNDVVVTGTVAEATGDDRVVFTFHTDDAQNGADSDFPTGKDIGFCFHIYRMTPDAHEGTARNRLIKALATFFTNGALTSGATSFNGGSIQVEHEVYGAYKVVVHAPGKFAGRYANEFVVGTSLNQDAISDNTANALVNIVDANTLEVEIYINDLEYGDETNGVAANSAVNFILLDTRPDARPDLMIGNKKSALRGNNIYNRNGAGQTAKLKGNSQKKTGRLFLEIENDGDIAENVRLKEQGSGPDLKVKLFRLTGGRTNITATVKANGVVAPDLLPGRQIQIEARFSARKKAKASRTKINFTGTSSAATSKFDTIRAKVKTKS